MMEDKVSELKKILEKKSKHKPKDLVESKPSPTTESPELKKDEFLERETELEQELEQVKVKLAEQKMEYLRKLAEFENFKKRLEKEKQEVIKFANENLLFDLFPVLDSFEMTLAHINDDHKNDPVVSGVELVYKQLLEVLKRNGIEEIGGIGEKFNPDFQEALQTKENQGREAGIVIEIHRKGYKLKDRLLRAALVTVSK